MQKPGSQKKKVGRYAPNGQTILKRLDNDRRTLAMQRARTQGLIIIYKRKQQHEAYIYTLLIS
jgi:hypothetical protein